MHDAYSSQTTFCLRMRIEESIFHKNFSQHENNNSKKGKKKYVSLDHEISGNTVHYAPETFKMWSYSLTLLKFDRFTDTPILCESNLNDFKWSKNVFLAILEVLNFDFSKIEQLSSPKFTKNSKFRVWNCNKMTFSDCLNLPNFDFT